MKSPLIDRFLDLASRGIPKIPDAASEPEENANVDRGIQELMGDQSRRKALMDLIDDLAEESNVMMGMGRKDHSDMLFHHGGYARLQELKAELLRLSGLTE